MKLTKKNIFISLFAVLYLCVGLVSTIHAVSFFGLANAPILGIILAITFEIGQAAVLFNLLTSPNQRKKFMPWALMCILTAVQILGNIFSSYKYLITNSAPDLRFFKEPIFVWTDLPDQQCNVIITYIVGAILPIVALCLTEMVTSYLYSEDENLQQLNNKINEPINELINEPINEPINDQESKEVITEAKALPDDLIITNPVEEEPIKYESPLNKKEEIQISEDSKIAANELTSGEVVEQENENKKKSHFINI